MYDEVVMKISHIRDTAMMGGERAKRRAANVISYCAMQYKVVASLLPSFAPHPTLPVEKGIFGTVRKSV